MQYLAGKLMRLDDFDGTLVDEHTAINLGDDLSIAVQAPNDREQRLCRFLALDPICEQSLGLFVDRRRIPCIRDLLMFTGTWETGSVAPFPVKVELFSAGIIAKISLIWSHSYRLRHKYIDLKSLMAAR